MTAPDPVETTPTEFPAPVLATPPLYENAATFEITSPIQMTQLIDEVSAATGRTISMAQSGPISGMEPVSPTNPATLSITPGNISRAKVEQAIADHQPTEGYDVPEGERRFTAVVQKLVDNEHAELSPEEIQDAVRGLVLRSTSDFPG